MAGALLAAVAALVTPGTHVFELATYPFAARGYVGSGSSIRPIDPQTLRPLRRHGLRIGDATYGPVYAPDGGRLAFGAEDFGEVTIVDMRRSAIERRIAVAPTGFGVEPVGWPTAHLLVLHVFQDSGKYGWLRNSLVLVDPTRSRVLDRTPLGNDVAVGYDPRTRRSVVLCTAGRRGTLPDLTVGIAPARLVVVDSRGRVLELRLARIRTGTAERRYGPHTRLAALTIDAGGGRAIVVSPREPVAEINLRALRVRYHRVRRLDPPASALERVPLAPWQGTMNPYSSDERWARPLWPGSILVGGVESRLPRREAWRSLFVPPRVLDTHRWRAHVVRGQWGDALFAGGRLIVGAARGWTAYDRRLRIRYTIPRLVPAQAFRNRLYLERRDGAATRVLDARTGRFLRRIRPTYIVPAFTWPAPRAASARRADDPPLLVPWTKVGDITLNEPATRVEREYGSVGHGFHVVDRYSGAIYGYYRLHGSKVFLTFDRGRVSDIGFTTPYYRTRSGFGVGSRIPLGPCHRTATTPCEHRWRGFLYNLRLREDPCRCWVKVGLGARSLRPTTENFLKPWFFIYLSHGRVARLYLAWRYVD